MLSIGETRRSQPAEIDVFASSEVVDWQDVVVRRSSLALRVYGTYIGTSVTGGGTE